MADFRPCNEFTQSVADLLANALIEAGAAKGRIALELEYLPAEDCLRLRERLPEAVLAPAKELRFDRRMIKTDAEIAAPGAIGGLSDWVMGEPGDGAVLSEIRIGMTGKAVGWSTAR